MGLADTYEKKNPPKPATPAAGYMDPKVIAAYQQAKQQDANRAETSSGYMDPKWQNPTAQWDPTTFNIKQNPAAPAAVANNQRTAQMGAGIPTAAQPEAPTAPTGIDINALFDGVIGKTNEYNNTGLAAYDEALKRINGNYDRSNEEMYAQYMGSRNKANEMASGLGGVNPSIYNNWDSGLRRIQESSDLARADSQSFFDKMKAATDSQYQEFLQGLQNQKAQMETDQALAILDYMNAQAAAKSGGGGSGRRSGGGSGSGSITETAKQTDTVVDPEAYNTYLMLKATDPKSAELFYESYLASTGSPVVKALTETIGKSAAELSANKYNPANEIFFNSTQNKINALTANPYVAAPGAAKALNDKKNQNAANVANIATAKNARNAALTFSGLFGNPKSTQTVTTSAKDKK